MRLSYDLFLTDADNINDVMSEDFNSIRLDNVDENDVLTICGLSDKYGFTVAAFLSTKD